jgi:glutaredoxin/glutathione-dependent peroxiredoxin
MAIKVGDRIPDVKVMIPGEDGMPTAAQTGQLLGTGKVVLFAVPGAFTPGCTHVHLPGYVVKADELKAKGVDTIACIAVNDAFVMKAWADSQNAEGIQMIGDGSGEFTKSVGLEWDATDFGFGTRSQRYAAVIEDGTVTQLFVEASPGVDISGAEKVLEAL